MTPTTNPSGPRARLPMTIWSSMPSIHLAPLFRELHAREDVDVVVRMAHELTPARRALGWRDDIAGYSSVFLDRRAPWRDAARAAWRDRHRFHLLHGIWGEPAFVPALLVLMLTGARFAVFSEGQDPRAPRSFVKRTAQRVFGRLVLRRASALLPIARLSLRFHESLGIPLPRVFPFCYFHPRPTTTPRVPSTESTRPCRLLFVARLDRDKGLDVLLRSVARLDPRALPHQLVVIGDGSERAAFEELTRSLGISERVTFRGRIDASEVPEAMAASDLLVLPTRWDGWGMVVNEAFSVGVPVITTDWCGAADLIVPGWNGFVVARDDVSALTAVIADYIAARERWPAMSAAALATAACVQADRGAAYVVGVVRSLWESAPGPAAPWSSLGAA